MCAGVGGCGGVQVWAGVNCELCVCRCGWVWGCAGVGGCGVCRCGWDVCAGVGGWMCHFMHAYVSLALISSD